MKILMVLESDFPPDTRVENEIMSLRGEGHELHIACYSHKEEFQIPQGLPYQIHKTYIPPFVYKASVGILKSGIYFSFWRKFLRTIFNAHSFDAIHIHDLPLAKLGYEFGQSEGIRFTLDLHENWPALLNISTHTNTFLGKILSSGKQWARYEKWSVTHADDVIVVVDEAKARIAELGANPEHIHVVSNTLNPEHFNFPKPERDGSYLTLVYGGGVNYHRGIQTVIEAMPLVAEKIPNIRVWIIGPGSYLENLKRLARELNVEKYVEFFGWMPLKDLLINVSKADIALIPHIKSPHTDSTIPHKLFQYMYAGIPILTSNCAPLERIVNETKTGISFKNQDAESFAEKLLLLLSDEEFRARMPENGKKWVLEKYHWEKDARVLQDLYKDA